MEDGEGSQGQGRRGRKSKSSSVREQEHHIPINSILKIMRRVLPEGAMDVPEKSQELMQECVTKFIRLVTDVANQRCQRDQRKIICSEDLITAIGRLGFDHAELLTIFLNRCREVRGEPSKKRKSTINYGPAFPELLQEPITDGEAKVNEVNDNCGDDSGVGGSSSQAAMVNYLLHWLHSNDENINNSNANDDDIWKPII